MLLKRFILPLCLAIGLSALGWPASAQLQYHVNLDTSGLNPASTYYTEFTLSDGHVVSLGTPDTNNSVTLSNFTFGGGASGAVLLPLVGNASGSTASSVLLADGDNGGTADQTQGFTPGSILGFDVSMTTSADAGGVPDTFTFYLLDSGLNAFPSNAPAQTPNALLRADITGPSMTLANVNTYSSSALPGPPTVTPAATATPEPGALTLFIGASLCGSLTALHRRRLANKR
jgi:hypothetical protein